MIDAARGLLAEARSIVSFSGAGLSAESGVPTFRGPALPLGTASGRRPRGARRGGPDPALWSRYDPTELASPQGFARDPVLVSDWYAWRRREIARATPNPAHRALAARGDVAHVTQNVDDLMERAGCRGVIHLHGTICRDRCNAGCGHREAVALTDPPPLRDCPRCGAPMRPDVVWFGEPLPPDAWSAAERACEACDLLLVVGTSAVVHPAAGLIGIAKASGARIVVVNTQVSEASGAADVELIGTAGELLPALVAI